MKYTGTVRWYNAVKGFGFITDSEGEDVFVHASQIVGEHIEEGDTVTFEKTVSGAGKLLAQNIQKINTIV